jgi:diaminopimelate epimerase
MKRHFLKMHGLGNDFAIFDARGMPLEMDSARVRALADRRTGIGCDQLILIEPSDVADVRMRIWNPDGGEVESCGNAARCVATLLGGEISIETKGGLLHGSVHGDCATVDMGEPQFGWHGVPLAYAMDPSDMPVDYDGLERPFSLNVGNPHVVFFVDDVDKVDLERLGPRIEHDALFPSGVNVNVASIGDGAIRLRVWERGAGLTRACGTGACATAVAAICRKLVESPVEVRLPGGALSIAWKPGQSIRMSGPGTLVFEGEVEW